MRLLRPDLFSRFFQRRDGVVAIVFALAIIPMMGLVGVAVDYSSATRARTQVLSIADSAALAAVSETIVRPEVPKAQQRSASLAAARSEFEGLLSVTKAAPFIDRVEFDAVEEGDAIAVKICFNGRQATSVMAIGGVTSLPFSGCATARSAPPVYVSVFALIDASGSMGIGATYADQANMERRLGCAFACHTINNVWDQACDRPGASIPRGWGSMTPKCAKAIGAKTRFDVVRDALIQVTDQAQALARVPRQYSIAVHKFSNYLTEVHPSSTAMPSLRNALERMVMDQRGGGTNFYKVMADFTRLVPESGDGKSPERPRVFVLFLTDGIGSRVFEEDRCFFNASLRPNCFFEGGWRWDPDYVLESPFIDGSIRSQAFPARLCNDLKRKNVTVMTLATEFDSSNINDGHMKSVDTTLRRLSLTGLRDCATATNMAYQANVGPDVDRAIRAMFANVVEKARITR
jgi:hypothetical protein